jgi:hypothetical protein
VGKFVAVHYVIVDMLWLQTEMKKAEMQNRTEQFKGAFRFCGFIFG